MSRLGPPLVAVLLALGCAPRPDTPTVAEATRRGLPPERSNAIGMALVLVPAGEFTMGTDDGHPNERPAHRVRITQPYYLGKHEVTQAEFRRFVEATSYKTTAERDGGAKVWTDGKWAVDEAASWKSVFVGARRPVVAVTWHDAVAFCEWLTASERRAGSLRPGESYALPTEAQWEWAARAGTDKRYFGTADRAEVCTFGNVPDRAADDAGFGRSFVPCNDNVGIGTAEVGAFSANAWGLHDMMGNVWEWVRDGYGTYHREAQLDPDGRLEADKRVVRGGSWSGKISGLRVTHRDGYVPDLRGGAVGFRVVLETNPRP
ncbi:MAG: formylglycine-generating enzyme family protein [Myxococcota bacterium]